jgi:hypothetical protein
MMTASELGNGRYLIESTIDVILTRIDQVQGMTNQLVLVAGPSGSGKTTALHAVAERSGFPYVAVGLALGELLLDVPPGERPLRVASGLDDLVRDRGPVVLLDNLEILFEPSLRVDPLALLEGLSRSRTVVAAWNGAVVGTTLTYAEPGHPEYRTYPRGQRVVVDLGATPPVENDR